MTIPSVVSLFCGCGGLDLGFKEQGFDLVYACDNDSVAVDCYARNVDTRVFLRSVTEEEFRGDLANLDGIDVVLGGFPCQGFSKAGPKDEHDSRNRLYLAMQEAVSRLRPTLFIAENVDGLSQNFGGTYVRQIVADFEQLGYRVEYRILDS
ncbi:MAG: DNA cytosine methyltransferase, partial [Planctomycetota bacterium]|nr:DNA cytosine methyltransferase [Planctomycetota bacterium]